MCVSTFCSNPTHDVAEVCTTLQCTQHYSQVVAIPRKIALDIISMRCNTALLWIWCTNHFMSRVIVIESACASIHTSWCSGTACICRRNLARAKFLHYQRVHCTLEASPDFPSVWPSLWTCRCMNQISVFMYYMCRAHRLFRWERWQWMWTLHTVLGDTLTGWWHHCRYDIRCRWRIWRWYGRFPRLVRLRS